MLCGCIGVAVCADAKLAPIAFVVQIRKIDNLVKTRMLFFLVCICLVLSTFPFPPVPSSISASSKYLSVFTSTKSFYVINDASQYPADLLSAYRTSLSAAAVGYDTSFNTRNWCWDDIGPLTIASNVQSHIDRTLVMGIAYQTEGTTLYHRQSTQDKILAALCYLSQYYTSSTTYSSDDYSWSVVIPNKIIDLIVVLTGVYTTSGIAEYYLSLSLFLGGLFTIPAQSQLIRDCTGDSSKWYDDTKCPASAILMELSAAKIVIFSSLLIGDLSSMTKYYNRVSEILEARDPDYSVSPQSVLYDGIRTDGTFIEYYSSVIFGSSGQMFFYLLSHVLAPAKQIEDLLLANKGPADQIKITSQASTILQEVSTYFMGAVLPFVANCGLVDSLSGADVASGLASPPIRFAGILLGLFQIISAAKAGAYTLPASYESIYKHCNYYILNCQDLKTLMARRYNFPSIGAWNKTTGVFLSSPTYKAELLRGHYPLIHGDQYAYQTDNFSLIIAMNSHRTRNFQCIGSLNKLGFYQAAGTVFPFVRDNPKQNDDYVLLASPQNYMGIIYNSAHTPDCSSQTHLYGTLSDGRFVSSITDGAHGSATIDYRNAPFKDVQHKSIYLMESLKQGLHVAQLAFSNSNPVTLAANLATIPFGNKDIIEMYVNGVKQTVTGGHAFTGARRILFNITPHTGTAYAAALAFPAALDGTISNVTIPRSYQDVGGTVTTQKTLYTVVVTTTLQKAATPSGSNQWQAFQPLVYSYYPHLPADTTDTQLSALVSGYTLSFSGGAQSGHTANDENGMLSYTQGNNKVIAANFYSSSTLTLYGSVTIRSNTTLQVLFVQTSSKYTLVIRNPVSSTATGVRLDIDGLADVKYVRHWCTTGGSTRANNLYVEACITRTTTCQIVITRGIASGGLPTVIPPSSGDPPYVPPSKPLDDLLYDASTDVINIPNNNESTKGVDWAIVAPVIVAVLLILLCVAIILWKFLSVRKNLAHIKEEIRGTKTINMPDAITRPDSRASDANLLQNSTSPDFTISSTCPTIEDTIRMSKRMKASQSRVFKQFTKQTTKKEEIEEDSEGIENDSVGDIPIHFAEKLFE